MIIIIIIIIISVNTIFDNSSICSGF